MQMKEMITEVRMNPSDHSVVKANGTFTIGGALAIRFTIINGKNGMFVSLPRQESKKEKGKWFDDVFPINRDARTELESVLLTEYEKALKQGPTAPAKKETPF